jgi:putative transposase
MTPSSQDSESPAKPGRFRLVGAMLLEKSEEWTPQRRYMQLQGLQTLSDTASARLPAVQR